MDKLTKKNIKFIDNYLLKSGVVFKDIRIEMLDHVANVVEERMAASNEIFYDAFKSYMINNKAHLLQQNIFSYKIYKSLFKEIVLKSISLKSGLIFLLALTLNYCLIYVFNVFETKENFVLYSYFILFFPSLLTILMNRFNLFNSISSGKRYSVINGMLYLLLIAYHVLYFVGNIFYKITEKTYILFITSVLVVFMFNYCWTLNQYINKYKIQFVNA